MRDSTQKVTEEAERAVLGAIITDNSLLSQAAVLQAQDFGNSAHRLIFGTIAELSKAGTAADIITVTQALTAKRQLSAVGGAGYVASLYDGRLLPASLGHWVALVRQGAARRLAEKEAEALQALAPNPAVSTEQLAARFAEASATLESYQKPATSYLSRVSDVQPQAVDWLWEGRIPKGTLTVFDGDPGRGKGLVVCDLAARITTGRDMPDGSPGAVGRVLYLTTEDAISFVVRPRLDVARANIDLVFVLTPGSEALIKFPDNCDLLKRSVRELEAALVIIDPLSAFLGDSINSHKDSDIRRALTPLHQLAEGTGVSIIGIRHLNKSNGVSAMYRGGGSIAIAAAARSLVVFGSDPEQQGDRIMGWVKLNIAELPCSLRYQVETVVHPALKDKYGKPAEIAKVRWLGESDVHADQLVQAAPDPEHQSQLDEGCELIRQIFGDSTQVLAMEAEKALRDAGISDGTKARARRKLGVASRKSSFNGKWEWFLTKPLPPKNPPSA